MPFVLVVTLLGLAVAAAGCRPRGPEPNVTIDWTLSPTPPQVGPSTLALTLSDSTGRPVANAHVEIEGNMSHPGMEPVLVTAREEQPGHYTASLAFTMAGDWFLLATIVLPDGRVLQRPFDVSGVRTP